MKKFPVICLMVVGIFVSIFVSSGSTAFAWGHGHFGVYIAPPPVLVSPSLVAYRGHYSPYFGQGYRYWVSGHWESRWTVYGWQRIWVPGYWQYN